MNLNLLKEKYKNKKVLITGHTGFKGSYLLVLLKTLGAKSYGYALKAEDDSLYNILIKEASESNEKLFEEEVIDDIRNYDRLYDFINRVKPDFIIHMAAQPLVRESYYNPRYTYDVNVMGTVNLFESIRKTDFSNKVSVLNVTTDKVYENKNIENYKFVENDILKGDDPYANSKSCSELVTYSYKNSFFSNDENITISTARAGNVIGGGDFAKDRILPDIYRAIKENKKVEIRNPKSTRPYQFVLEPIILYLYILMSQYEDKKYEANYNVGPDVEDILTTDILSKKILDYWGIKQNKDLKNIISYKEEENTLLKEKKYLGLDNSLIKKTFNYSKIYDNDTMIKNTVDIYDLVLNNEKILNRLEELCNSIF